MELYVLYIAAFCHVLALISGIFILKKFTPEFTTRPCIFKNGLDEIEISYLSIVFSTLIAPVTLYHLMIALNIHDINLWDAVYWAALGLLLALFHFVTNRLMEKVRKDGIFNSSI